MTTTQQHRYEVWASNLLYLTFAISLVTDFVLKCGYFASYFSDVHWFMLLAVNPFLLFVYYKIRRGLRDAKLLFLACYAFVFLQVLNEGISPAAYNTEFKAFSLAAQHTSQLLACLFLLLSLRTPTESSLEIAK